MFSDKWLVRWFKTLDLDSGYWQAEILDTDRPKTVLSCQKGLYQFKVLPLGTLLLKDLWN